MATKIELKSYHYIATSGKHIESGMKTALVKTSGPKWMSVLMMDGTLTVSRVPAEELGFMKDLTRKGKPYPLKRAVRHFRAYGKAHGISKGAKKFLREAIQ